MFVNKIFLNIHSNMTQKCSCESINFRGWIGDEPESEEESESKSHDIIDKIVLLRIINRWVHFNILNILLCCLNWMKLEKDTRINDTSLSHDQSSCFCIRFIRFVFDLTYSYIINTTIAVNAVYGVWSQNQYERIQISALNTISELKKNEKIRIGMFLYLFFNRFNPLLL